MIFLPIFWIILMVIHSECTECPNIKTSPGALRKRRHLTFPDGSSMILTISLVKAFMTHAPAGWNIALEVDVIYPLPDAEFTNAHFRKRLHHRQKRLFWERLENAIDYHNLNGRACILRSICEAKSYLAPPGKSMVHDVLRTIFTKSENRLLSIFQTSKWQGSAISKIWTIPNISYGKTTFEGAPVQEEDFPNEVANTYSELLEPNFCEKINNCPFSLIHFVLSLNRQPL